MRGEAPPDRSPLAIEKGIKIDPSDNDSHFTPALTQAGMMTNDDKLQTPAMLSDREIEIIELITAGLTNKDIADRLDISKRTVDNHITHILEKAGAGVDNRVALVRWALQWGKVCLDDINCCSLSNRE